MKKILAGLLLAAMLCGISAGCAGEAADADADADDMLTIYFLEQYDPESDVKEYVYREHQNILQELKYFANGEDGSYTYIYTDLNEYYHITEINDPELYMQKLTEDIMAGGGPDLIFFTEGMYDEPYRQLAKAGLLENLDPFIESDTSADRIDLSAWVEPLTDLYIINGERLALPLDMYTEGFSTTTDILQHYGLSLPEGAFSDTAVLDLLAQYTDKASPKPEEPFFVVNQKGISAFNVLLRSAGKKWWDKTEKSTLFDTAEFRSFVEKYTDLLKKYPSFACTDPALFYTGVSVAWDEYRLALYSGGSEGERGLPSEVMQNFTESLYCNEGKYTAVANNYIAINKNSKHKEKAYALLKQIANYEGNAYNGLPVNTAISRQYYVRKIDSTKLNYSELTKTVKERRTYADFDEFVTDIENREAIATQIGDVLIPDRYVQQYLDEMIANIVEKNEPVGDAISELQRKTMEYFNK